MNEFYNLHESIKAYLLGTNLITTFSWGDVFDIDLNKKNEYAIAHLMYQGATYEGAYNTVTIDIIFADLVDDSEDNTLDVMNQMLVVGTMLCKAIDGGDLWANIKLNGTPTFEPFKERFEMNLAGWVLSLDVYIPNNVARCD